MLPPPLNIYRLGTAGPGPQNAFAPRIVIVIINDLRPLALSITTDFTQQSTWLTMGIQVNA